MRLSDAMSAADLAVYAEIGLVIFLGVFLAVAARLLWMNASDLNEQAMIPLSDEPKPTKRVALPEDER